jgi:hypothetical protein
MLAALQWHGLRDGQENGRSGQKRGFRAPFRADDLVKLLNEVQCLSRLPSSGARWSLQATVRDRIKA